MNRFLIAATALAFTAGCLTEGNFSTKTAKTVCKRAEECDRGEFESEFDSLSDCVETIEDFTEPLFGCFETAGCEFQRDKASSCLNSIQDATCEQYVEGINNDDCTEVYECTDGQAIDAGRCILEQ